MSRGIRPPRQRARASDRGALASALLERGVYGAAIVAVLVFILWPTLAVVWESVLSDEGLTLQRYAGLFSENAGLLWNSIWIATAATVLSVALGLVVALYMRHSKGIRGKVVFGTMLLTMISPPFVSALSYVMLFGRRGLITYDLLRLNVNPYGWHGVLLMQMVGFTPLAALLIYGVTTGMDPRLEQASLDLGASSFRTFLKVTLPLARPGIVAAGLITFVRSLSDFGTPIIIGGNFTVLATEAYLNVIALYDMGTAAAMGTLLLLPALVAFVIYRRTMRDSSMYGTPAEDAGYPARLPRTMRVLIALLTWVFVIFVMVKYGTIVSGSFTKTWGVDFSFSLRHWEGLNGSAIESFWRSIRYSLVAGVGGSFLGLLLAYVIERRRFPGRRAVEFVAMLPFLIPGPFFGIGYAIAFRQYPLALTGTAAIVVLNAMFRQIPVSAKAGAAVLSQADPILEDASADLGASRMRTLVRVVWPQLKPAFLVSFINTFTATMTTIGAIIFLISPSAKVATVVMFGAIRSGHIGEGTVFATLMIVVVLAVNLGFSWLFLRRSGTSRTKGVGYVSSLEALDQGV
ncbi:MAG: iron ABC transporter permease [Coriobacteriia bacterium]|nr:iron ABC transporter permease [Coriobacteriia bacterium]